MSGREPVPVEPPETASVGGRVISGVPVSASTVPDGVGDVVSASATVTVASSVDSTLVSP